MTLERINIGHGISLGAGLRETALLDALAGKARPRVHNGVYRSYVLPPTTLSGRTFRPSVYFTDGLLTSVSLTWVNPETEGGSGWEDFSFERERSIAKEDAAWLSSFLPDVGSATSTYWFDWGTVWSGFDERGGFSSIVVRYGHS
jgi:hypothetical protein